MPHDGKVPRLWQEMLRFAGTKHIKREGTSVLLVFTAHTAPDLVYTV